MPKDEYVAYPWPYVGTHCQTRLAPALPLQADKKVPAIQGLRGVAVLLVVFFHALTRYVPFGWIGVWLFFAISGFVITLSLEKISSKFQNSSSLMEFYRRRAKRIIPLYFVTLFGGYLICVVMVFAGRSNVPSVLDHLPFLLSFTYNFYRMLATYEHTELFGHLWSLCLEEQFYLIYPFVFLFLSRSARIRLLVVVVLICPLGRLCLNLYLNKIGYSEEQIGIIIYLSPLGNFDAFSAGSLAACLGERTSRLSARFWFGVIATLILALISYLAIRTLVIEASFADVVRSALSAEVRGVSNQVFIYSFLALLGSVLVVVCANYGLSHCSIFAISPLVWLGELSYGIYMYHFPLLYLRSEFLPASIPEPYAKLYGFGVLMTYLIVLLLIAHLSFRHLERPFLYRSGRNNRHQK